MTVCAQSDYFSLFGLAKMFTQDVTAIKSRFYQLQQTAHPDKFANSGAAEKRAALLQAAMINDAYQILCSPLKRAIYLLKLYGIDVQLETDTAMSPVFLMEQMELREKMALQQESVADEINAKLMDCENTLRSLLDNEPSLPALQQARTIVRQMQFFVRLQEEI